MLNLHSPAPPISTPPSPPPPHRRRPHPTVAAPTPPPVRSGNTLHFELEAEIREAFAEGRIEPRQLNVDYSPAG